MIRCDDELATKIVYLKENGYMPNIDDEMPDVQRAMRSFYYGEYYTNREGYIIRDSPFWFKLTFCDYQVSDDFVHEVNREYKRFQILNIGKSEFGPNFQ